MTIMIGILSDSGGFECSQAQQVTYLLVDLKVLPIAYLADAEGKLES